MHITHSLPPTEEFAAPLGRKFRCRAGVCAYALGGSQLCRCWGTGPAARVFYTITAILAIPFSPLLAVQFWTNKQNTKKQSKTWQFLFAVARFVLENNSQAGEGDDQNLHTT